MLIDCQRVWVGLNATLIGYLTAAQMLKAEGTWAEEESVPRHGRRGPSVQGWFKRLSDLTVFPEQVKRHNSADSREHTRFAKTQKTPSLSCSARAITHLIPEVRPKPGQRVALFKKRSRRFCLLPAKLCYRCVLPSL